MTRKLDDEIIGVFATFSQRDPSELSLETEIRDVGIHSLELTEIIMELEERYGIAIEIDTVDAWSSLVRIKDVVAAVDDLLAAKTAV